METKFTRRLDLLNNTLDNLIDVRALKEFTIDCDEVITGINGAISIVEFKIKNVKPNKIKL